MACFFHAIAYTWLVILNEKIQKSNVLTIYKTKREIFNTPVKRFS